MRHGCRFGRIKGYQNETRPRIGDAVLVPALARADTVWSYTSELLNYDVIGPFQSSVPVPANPCNCFLTGSVVEDSNFNVVSYIFTDGTSTLNNLNSTASIFAFATPIGNFQNTPPFPGAQPFSNWFLSVVGLGANAGSIN